MEDALLQPGKQITADHFIEEVRSLAESGELLQEGEFATRTEHRASSDLVNEEAFTDEFSLNDLLEKASSRNLLIEYDDGTDLSFHLIPFSPESGAVLTVFDPDDDIDLEAELVSGDLEKGFEAACRTRLEDEFEDGVWIALNAVFSSGEEMVTDDEYPVEDDAFWKRLLAAEPEESDDEDEDEEEDE